MREALEQRARRAVREADAVVVVEGEHRHVDLGQHLVEEPGSFHRLEPLRAECRAEAVRFEHDVAERIALARVASADAVVAAAQRLQQVRDRAHRLNGRLVDRDREGDPGADQDHNDEPLHRVRDRRVAQQQDGSQQRRQSTGERQQHDARLESQAMPSRDRAAVQGLSRLAFFRHGAGVCAIMGGRASRARFKPRHSSSGFKPSFSSRRYIALRERPSASAAAVTLPALRLIADRISARSASSSLMSSSPGGPTSAAESRRSAVPISSPAASKRLRSTTLLSSRTLPGQAYCCSAAMASASKPLIARPYCAAFLASCALASSRISSRRSRSGGSRISTVLMRNSRSSRKRPSRISAGRSALVAETTRTSARCVREEPTRSKSPVSSARSSRACCAGGTLPISSRKIVPPSASSKRPPRSALASVKAPFTWPNISLSNTDSARPPAFTAMKDFSARSDQSCISRASRLLPVPGSPVISTLASERATWRASRTTSCIGREVAIRLAPSLARRIAFSSASRRPRCRAWASATWLRSTDSSRWLFQGFSRKSFAPWRIACTATSTVAQAVITTTGRSWCSLRSCS